jgi:hypothetical protein
VDQWISHAAALLGLEELTFLQHSSNGVYPKK